MATITNHHEIADTPAKQTHNVSQPDQLDQEHISPRHKEEAPLKSSVVISSVEAKDLNKETIEKPEDVRKGLVGLHSRIDSILSRSGVFSVSQSPSLIVETPLKSSVLSAHYHETYVSGASASPLKPIHDDLKTMASRVVTTLAQSRHNYPGSPLKSASYVTSAGYEVKTLASVEQALHNRSNISYQYSASPLQSNHQSVLLHTSSPSVSYYGGNYDLKPVYEQERYHVYEPVRSSVPTAPGVNYHAGEYERYHQSRNTQYQNRDHYYTGDITNDKDSIVLDYLENQEEYSEPEFVEEEQDPRVRVHGNSGEEEKEKNASLKKQKDNSELVLKGPYSQRKRDRITSEQAKKFFERSNEIEDFDFRYKGK